MLRTYGCNAAPAPPSIATLARNGKGCTTSMLQCCSSSTIHCNPGTFARAWEAHPDSHLREAHKEQIDTLVKKCGLPFNKRNRKFRLTRFNQGRRLLG